MSPVRLFATVLGVSLGFAAMAHATPRLSGGGDTMTITSGAIPGHTNVGGAHATLQGGGENRGTTAAPGGRARDGRLGVVQGGGQNQRVVYDDGRPHGWAGTPAETDDRGHRG
jgi:hypothetical protein